jgi:eukaryotic-like serine/threonine-protein kinase
MNITEPIVLPPDVWIIPASEVAEDIRVQCACGRDDFIVTRPHSRTRSRVVNSQVAELLKLFRSPKTIVEAVLELCLAHGTDPEDTLEQAFAALRPFLQTNWLVEADSEGAKRIEPSFRLDEVMGSYRIIDCRQLLEDTEVYRVRTETDVVAALKIGRPGATAGLEKTFKHEARILRYLNGQPAPRLLSMGSMEDRPYLVMTWCAGAPISQVATELRQLFGTASQRSILDLCCTVLRAYSTLHEKGIIHGDVYPKNILVDATRQVSIVDFGSARLVENGDHSTLPRRGVPEFYEPELAAAALEREPKPDSSFSGEQYALAALVYLLITGEPYLRFSAVRDEMLCQIVEERPLTFAERGLPAWPKLEAVLSRALEKDPGRRFSSVAEFARALDEVDPPDVVGKSMAPMGWAQEASRELIARLDANDIAGFRLPTEIPLGSITHGAAGVAYALYCVACARGDAKLLSAADAWAMRAVRTKDQQNAFTNDQLNLDEGKIGQVSVYYGRPGVHLVQALIAQAMGDEASLGEALRSYVDACRAPCECLDLTLGRSGVLTGCALLLDAFGPGALQVAADHPLHQLVDLGRSTLHGITGLLGKESFSKTDYLGVAHGWAGICYAALLWSEVSGDALPAHIHDRLENLVDLAEDSGHGVRWPTKVDKKHSAHGGSYMESWCHGAPGYVHLWTAAFRALREPIYLQIAERAAWTAWEALESPGSLCCGYAGRAYALLSLYRHTGDRGWVSRAAKLSERAVETCERDPRMVYSLFKGALGAAVLMEDLNVPERASFPLFEREVRGGDILS